MRIGDLSDLCRCTSYGCELADYQLGVTVGYVRLADFGVSASHACSWLGV